MSNRAVDDLEDSASSLGHRTSLTQAQVPTNLEKKMKSLAPRLKLSVPLAITCISTPDLSHYP